MKNLVSFNLFLEGEDPPPYEAVLVTYMSLEVMITYKIAGNKNVWR